MEILGYLWNLAPLWILLVVVGGVIVFVALRARRSRSLQASSPNAEPASVDTEADMLDSSHIGFAPMVGVVESPRHDRGAAAGGDSNHK